MKPVEPISTLELYPGLSQKLQETLLSLDAADWSHPTACSPWDVKDVAAHLLGGNFGRLWQPVEGSGPPPTQSLDYDALVAHINFSIEQWVQAARRISPATLIELLELTDRRLYTHFKKLDLDAPAGLSVAWAGEDSSPNWFDIAREYTEKWLHQQHIREAVGQPLLLEREWYYPILDTFLRGLPHTYRGIEALEGTCISVEITGAAGGVWTLWANGRAWYLFEGLAPDAACRVSMEPDLAWRLFTRGIDRGEAQDKVRIKGNQILGKRVLDMTSIMA